MKLRTVSYTFQDKTGSKLHIRTLCWVAPVTTLKSHLIHVGQSGSLINQLALILTRLLLKVPGVDEQEKRTANAAVDLRHSNNAFSCLFSYSC